MSSRFDSPRFDLSEETEDELVLGQLEEVLWSNRTRLRREPEFAAELALAVDACIGFLVPNARESDTDAILSKIAANLARAPALELDMLSSRLLDAAARESYGGNAKAIAVSLVAGWLKAAAMEVTAEKTVRRAAHQLKGDHELLFERLLSERKAVA